ncbi:helix-turn-helix domain-containing protein [Mycobacterium sp. 050134]|uniref:helix-turn-helix domain-containing protein n=1 Tax=Mycobacterium sp. 050134 TaxID=3096111 RepID=UPI003FA5CBB1
MAAPRRSKRRRDSPMPDLARIGETIVDRRMALRLTQQTLADLAGVSRSSVQALEKSNGSTRIGSVFEIAEVLGLRLDVSVMSE